LMKEKDFNSITTAQIAKNAEVTEGLIYKYFKDKKDLLYQVLNDDFVQFLAKIEDSLDHEKTCVGKLERIIFLSLESYAENRVFSKILLLEVRNSPEYFNSPAYGMVRKYTGTILGIIEEGVKKGELKADIDPHLLQKVILGAIEHACLGKIIFGKKLDITRASNGITTIVFNGVKAC
jgi:TetR/AcrR family fatty acid metabolism transcriptional regulator